MGEGQVLEGKKALQHGSLGTHLMLCLRETLEDLPWSIRLQEETERLVSSTYELILRFPCAFSNQGRKMMQEHQRKAVKG